MCAIDLPTNAFDDNRHNVFQKKKKWRGESSGKSPFTALGISRAAALQK